MADTIDTIWGAAKGVLQTVAPTIATALGGPLAGAAVSALSNAVFGTPNKTPDELAAAITGMTGDQMVALKKAESDFKVQMKQLDIDVLKLNAEDRDSARKREAEVKDWMPRLLALIVVASSLGAGMSILVGHVGVDSTIAGTVLGYLVSESKQVLNYYFGSSAGSSAKTGLLFRSSPTPDA